jgi:protoporphyrin/coproporphyrin ferrochelatase
MSKGVLLVNLGSPDSPAVGDVRRYLGEFLMDGRVLDVNPVLRACIVYLGILPRRPRKSAEAYRKIWTPEGSPLVVTSRRVQTALQKRLPVPVELAMRYQHPSIAEALERLDKAGVDELLVIPLFPHYATSSYETAVVRVRELAERHEMRIVVQPPCFERPDYIAALVANAEESMKRGYDYFLFSFHGIPERHLRKADPTRCHCLASPNCCEGESPAHATCYRAQCFRTVAAFVKRAGVPKEKYSISFQSRLGRTPWLKPYTDFELIALAQRGVKRLLVMCPSFVSDCLETLEEIGIRGRESFIQSGGQELELIPCLNEHPLWLGTLEKMIGDFVASGGQGTPRA